MSPTPQQQGVPFFNWMNQMYQHKEVPKPHVHGSSWSRPNTSVATAAVSSPFNSFASPVMSTPFLDSSADEALSPVCFSPYPTASPHLGQHSHHQQHQHHQHHHYPHQHADITVGQYIDQGTKGKEKLIFNVNPIELLIDKSKAVNTSPSLFASDEITTPLFGPISSSFDSGDNGQLNHPHQHPQQGSGTLSHDHGFPDWPFYEGDSFLFHAFEGITETPTPTPVSMTFYDDQTNIKLEPVESTSSPANDQNPSDQSETSYSTTENHNVENNIDNKNTLKNDNNSNIKKRQRKNSNASNYSSDGSEPENNKRRRRTSAKANDSEKRHGCPICRRKFSRRYNLHTHIQTHNVNRVKAFSCEVCGNKFDRKHDRDRHLESVHLGKKSYKCQVCDAAFCRRDALSRHALKFHGGNDA